MIRKKIAIITGATGGLGYEFVNQLIMLGVAGWGPITSFLKVRLKHIS